MKMKRTRLEDGDVADRGLCLPPHVPCEDISSNCSLVYDVHHTKKRSIFQVNLFENRDLYVDPSPVEPTITTSFKKSLHCSETFYTYTKDVCSLASSVDSCDDTVCIRNREALSSDADSSILLNRKAGNCRLVVRLRGVRLEPRIPHRSELKSYRRTLEEFYGHGPLSWEQEGYLAELRSKLHISNDEHLREDNIWSSASKVTGVVMLL